MGYGPALGPTIKKALCHTCPLGGVVIKYHRCHGCTQTSLLNCDGLATQSTGRTLVSRACLGADLPECWLIDWRFPPASGGHPPAFHLLQGVRFIAWRMRGMPTGPKLFLPMQDACGLRPCGQPHLKNGLVTNLYVGGTYDKYPGVPGSVLRYRPFYFLSTRRMLASKCWLFLFILHVRAVTSTDMTFYSVFITFVNVSKMLNSIS